MELLEKYVKEISEDLKIDEFNMKEVAMRLPARKHYWVAVLIRHKKRLLDLENEKSKFREDITKEVNTKSPVKLSPSSTSVAVESSEKMKLINNQIAEEKILIEFLEKTEKVLSSASFDLKSAVEISKLEQM